MKSKKEPSLDEMDRRLQKTVEDIKKEAAGRTCGDCIHYLDYECLSQVNIDENPIKIYSRSAIACRYWETNT